MALQKLFFIKRPLKVQPDPTPLGFDLTNPNNTIDTNVNSSTYHNASSNSTPAGTEIDYSFENPIKKDPLSNINKIFIEKIVFRKILSNDGRVTINDTEFTSNWSDTGFNYVTVNVNQEFTQISNLTLFLETAGTSTAESRLYDVKIHGHFFFEPNFEFNDSVLETKAWNSSRYDGRQLSAKKINKATQDDIGNNNKIPIIRNYTRNIYLGNEIVGMNEVDPEDPTLVQFPDFSYAQITSFITVNEDGSLTRNSLDPEESNETQKRAFYRPFVRDFPEGSFCNFILGDPTVKNNLKSKYPIYFNGGQLKKLLTLQTKTNAIGVNPSDFFGAVYRFRGIGNGGHLYTERLDRSDPTITLSGSLSSIGFYDAFSQPLPQPVKISGAPSALYLGGFVMYSDKGDNYDVSPFDSVNTSPLITGSYNLSRFYNEDIYSTWYTGSLKYENAYTDLTSLLISWDGGNSGRGTNIKELYQFTKNFVNYRNRSNYKGDKRMFITAAGYNEDNYFQDPYSNDPPTIDGNAKPLYTFEPNSIHSGSVGFDNKNLSTLTTLEIADIESYHNPSTAVGPFGGHILEFIFNQKDEVVIDCHSLQTPNIHEQSTFGKGFVPNFSSGSFIFSVTDDDVPSVLVPLKKERDLQNGKGDKPFVVIPENLHPYVKDNLIFYLSKAGIDIGGSATDKVEENLGKKPRASKLSPRELRLLALERLRQNQERRKTIETARRDRRRAITRREDREERRQRRVKNREERRKNRKDRKENRQENRQNRRQRRRNRRRNR